LAEIKEINVDNKQAADISSQNLLVTTDSRQISYIRPGRKQTNGGGQIAVT
jgi:hypothetical protein